MFYEIKIKINRLQDNGEEKVVSELYVLTAESFSDAEYKITEYIAPNLKDMFNLCSIKKSNISEVTGSGCEDGMYWKVTVGFITLDEKSGKDKVTNSYYLVMAKDETEAIDTIKIFMKGTLADYKIVGVNETKVVEVLQDADDGTDADCDETGE